MKNLQLGILTAFGWCFLIIAHTIVLLLILLTAITYLLPPFRILQKAALCVYSAVYYVFEQIENAKLILQQ